LAEFSPAAPGPVVAPVVSGGAAYFAAAAVGDAQNVELWKTDGTAAGTVRVSDINPGASGSAPASLTDSGRRMYFTAQEPAGGRELWVTDGTEAGTRRVADV